MQLSDFGFPVPVYEGNVLTDSYSTFTRFQIFDGLVYIEITDWSGTRVDVVSSTRVARIENIHPPVEPDA